MTEREKTVTMIANPISQVIEYKDEFVDPNLPLSEYRSYVLVDRPGVNVFESGGVLEAFWELGPSGQAMPGAHPHLHGFEPIFEHQDFWCPERRTWVRYSEVWRTETVKSALLGDPWWSEPA